MIKTILWIAIGVFLATYGIILLICYAVKKNKKGDK